MRRTASTFLSIALLLAAPLTTVWAETPKDLLAEVVASRSAEDRARDSSRHPVATLDFFNVEPGMSVAEALPGGGWYTTILANFLGPKGSL